MMEEHTRSHSAKLDCLKAVGTVVEEQEMDGIHTREPDSTFYDTYNTSTSGIGSLDTVYTNPKAGMESVDQEKVKKVVYEMSKSSSYYSNEQRKSKQTSQRIQDLLKVKAQLTARQLEEGNKVYEAYRDELEAGRDLRKTWIHVDLDAFFASVEELLDPSLKDTAFAVGGIGMISTASYAARTFGVRSAMPGFIALKLCPHLRFVNLKFDMYKKYAMKTREVFARFDGEFEAGSLDEAYLDATEYCKIHGVSGSEAAERLREQVQRETGGLTCSCGIAPNKMLAKICSDINKPNGVFELKGTKQDVIRFMKELSIRKVPGIGRVTEHVLSETLNIRTCGDMLEQGKYIMKLFSECSSRFFIQCALGIGATAHDESNDASSRKSVSCERTFAKTRDASLLMAKLKDIASSLAKDMETQELQGKTITLKIKHSSFEVHTRSVTLSSYICSAEDMFFHGSKILERQLPAEVRLMGLRMSNFYIESTPKSGQLILDQLLKADREKNQEGEGNVEAGTMPPGDQHPQEGNTLPTLKHVRWTCSACTYINENKSNWCEMCMTSRRSGYRPGTIEHEREKGRENLPISGQDKRIKFTKLHTDFEGGIKRYFENT